MTLLLVAVLSLLVGAGGGALWARSRNTPIGDVAELATVREQLRQAQSQNQYLDSERTTLGHLAAELRERIAIAETQLVHAQQRLREQAANDEVMAARFDELAKRSMRENSEQMIKAAEAQFKLVNEKAKGDLAQQQVKIEHLVKPVQEQYDQLQAFIAQSEKERSEQFGNITEQMKALFTANGETREAANSLRNVLNSSTSARGRWGEMSLRTVVGNAGMTEHVDFTEQSSVTTDDGRSRADMIINLPTGHKIAIDAKVPFSAFQEAQNCDDPTQQKKLYKDHSKALRLHVDALIKRAYWEQYLPSCDYAVLYVPGDGVLDSALMHDEALFEYATQNKIMLATPSTLLPMLRLAAMTWAQQSQAENATEIASIGKELLKRLVKADEHVTKMGRGLKQAVGSFNEFVGSYDNRIKPQAQKLSKLSGAGIQFQQLADVTEVTREIRQRTFDEIEEIEVLEIVDHSEAG